MRRFCVAYHTDIGTTKEVNQDSLLLKGITDGIKEIYLAGICDGMGGMEKGELASATVVRTFSDWFYKVYMPKADLWTEEEIMLQWKYLLKEENQRLNRYGKEQRIQLGTTASVILVSSDGRYVIAHVGDTRIYKLSDQMEQLTEDHSFVAREIKRGTMSMEQAAKDPRRNALLQCIGTTGKFEPQVLCGRLRRGEPILLCSDGFRHKLSDQEIYEQLFEVGKMGEQEMKETLIRLTEWNKQRDEVDNISVVMFYLK